MSRWTESKKNRAIEMIKSGIKNNEISKVVYMSESSVSLLKYKNVLEYDERIKCEICGKQFKQITQKHLRNKHNIDLDEYKIKFPSSELSTKNRAGKYKSFKHPNKGKTYSEIYGNKEAEIKRNKISKKQIGRPAPYLAGTGITGTRRDTNTYARSTYEANLDRIFIFENKKYISELSVENERFALIGEDGVFLTYQPDRIDVNGLFEKGAYLEIKGYMYPQDWKKIQLFREQYKDKRLLVISSDEKYCDINYSSLKAKYKNLIPLWEGEKQNYKTRPDLYKIGYQTPEHIKYLNDNYPNHINLGIKDNHYLFIANKCLLFNKTRLGKKPYVEGLKLVAITDRRPTSSRKSSGVYNYELWEIETTDNEKFYVTNQDKTVTFYCYQQNEFFELIKFFNDNCNHSLAHGRK